MISALGVLEMIADLKTLAKNEIYSLVPLNREPSVFAVVDGKVRRATFSNKDSELLYEG